MYEYIIQWSSTENEYLHKMSAIWNLKNQNHGLSMNHYCRIKKLELLEYWTPYSRFLSASIVYTDGVQDILNFHTAIQCVFNSRIQVFHSELGGFLNWHPLFKANKKFRSFTWNDDKISKVIRLFRHRYSDTLCTLDVKAAELSLISYKSYVIGST